MAVNLFKNSHSISGIYISHTVKFENNLCFVEILLNAIHVHTGLKIRPFLQSGTAKKCAGMVKIAIPMNWQI